jgi:hypothetical protein
LNRIAQDMQTSDVPVDDIILTAHTSYVIYVNPRLVVSLDFGKAYVVVEPWEKASVRVTPNMYFNSYVELLNEHNLILFDHESYLEENPFTAEEAGFVIKVPKSAVLAIVAGQCTVRDCIITSVKSSMLKLYDCMLVDDFRFLGEYANVHNSTVGKHSSFRAHALVMKHCSCATLMVNGNDRYTDMSVELRNVRGNGVWLGSQRVRSMGARLHHVRLDRLVVHSAIEDGSIILEGSKIAQIENHSALPVLKSVLRYRRECA